MVLLLGGIAVAGTATDATRVAIDTSRLGMLKGARTLLSEAVADNHQRKVGTIEDLLVEPSSGRISALLVQCRTGVRIVPPQSVKSTSTGRVQLELGRAEVESGPMIDLKTGPGWLESPVLKQFRQTSGKPAESLERPWLASKLAGIQLSTKDGQRLGTIKDAAVDLPQGRLIYWVVDCGETLPLYPVPGTSVDVKEQAAELQIARDAKWFLAGPHFDREFWSQLAMPELAEAVQTYYGLSAATPPYPTPNPSLTRAVLSEINNSSPSLGNVMVTVTTENGRVALSGTVQTETQKRQVISAAERVAGPGAVIDRLQIRGKTKTARL